MFFLYLFQWLYKDILYLLFFMLLLKQLQKFSMLHLSLAKCKLADLLLFHSPSTTVPWVFSNITLNWWPQAKPHTKEK